MPKGHRISRLQHQVVQYRIGIPTAQAKELVQILADDNVERLTISTRHCKHDWPSFGRKALQTQKSKVVTICCGISKSGYVDGSAIVIGVFLTWVETQSNRRNSVIGTLARDIRFTIC